MTDPWSADLMTSRSFRWQCNINKNCLSVCLYVAFRSHVNHDTHVQFLVGTLIMTQRLSNSK